MDYSVTYSRYLFLSWYQYNKTRLKRRPKGKILTPLPQKYNTLIDQYRSMGEVCMKGNIITTERCMVCDKVLKHDDRRHGLFYPNHPQISVVKIFIIRFGRHIQRQFSYYNKAAQFLNGLRFKTGEGSFDVKDYLSDKPYSFQALSEKYLKRKKNLVSGIWICSAALGTPAQQKLPDLPALKMPGKHQSMKPIKPLIDIASSRATHPSKWLNC